MSQTLRWLIWPVITGIIIGLTILALQPRTADERETPAMASPGYASAFSRAAPAVVNVYTTKVVKEQRPSVFDDPILRHFFRRGNPAEREKVERSLGSGVIVSDAGYLLTNLHVIQGADEILVLLHDGRQAIARLIGGDPETDLAVLKIDLPDLTPIPLSSNKQTIQVGDIVLAIGNPYGFGQSMSQGIVSAKGRYGLGLSNYENFIQTDAAINPGNSGGALVDHRGHLIGINTAIYTQSGGSTGIGLAIPVDLALRTMSDIIEYGRPVRGWLGLEVKSVAAQRNGVVVSALMPNGPAAKAGLRVGDMIYAINEKSVGDGHAGMNEIATTRPGDTVKLSVARNGQRSEVEIIVGIRPTPTANN